MKNRTYLYLAIFLLLVTSCKKKDREVYFDNTKTYIYTDFLVSSANVNWDVKLVINGEDFGIIKAGEIAGPFTFTGTKFKIDSFVPQITCMESYVSHTYDSGVTYCISALNDEVEDKAQAYRDTSWNIPVFNDEWTWDIGFGHSIQ